MVPAQRPDDPRLLQIAQPGVPRVRRDHRHLRARPVERAAPDPHSLLTAVGRDPHALEAVDQDHRVRHDGGGDQDWAQDPHPLDRRSDPAELLRRRQSQARVALVQVGDRDLVAWLSCVGHGLPSTTPLRPHWAHRGPHAVLVVVGSTFAASARIRAN